MSCSCCGDDTSTVPLRARADIELCRESAEWLLGRVGASSTPILPVGDLVAAVAFYERAGFGVRIYPGDHGEAGDGFAFVDFDGQSLFDLDAAPDMDPAANCAGCYVTTADVEKRHDRMRDAGLPVTTPVVQPWGMREFDFTDPWGNRLRIGRPVSEDDFSPELGRFS